MKYFALSLMALMLISMVSCSTTGAVARHKAEPLPPEIQKAQDEVWAVQFELYQAEHDLAIAQLDAKREELLSQKSQNQAAYSAQYNTIVAKLEVERSRIEERFGLEQQWYSAVQNGDTEGAASLQDQISHI